jgi:hypothetical protein
MTCDEFKFFPADTKNPTNKYTQPKSYSVSVGEKSDIGYPNNISSTQTVVTRGSGAAVRGNKSSSRLA